MPLKGEDFLEHLDRKVSPHEGPDGAGNIGISVFGDGSGNNLNDDSSILSTVSCYTTTIVHQPGQSDDADGCCLN